MKVDSNGFVYLCGYSSSADFPTSSGAYGTQFHKNQFLDPDIFASKLDSSGTKLIWSTFIGSFVDDYAESFAFDSSKNLVITGYVNQTKFFPVTYSAFDTSNNGGFDCFVLKLKYDGASLIWSTLIGGAKDDYAQSIVLDKAQNVYFTGYTVHEGSYPYTPGAYMNYDTAKNDVFISKLSSNGSTLSFSSVFGGANDDFGQSVDLDNSNNIYILATTSSKNYPISADAVEPVYHDKDSLGNLSDLALTKLNPDGSALKYSTFIGGNSRDIGYCLKLDTANNCFIAGYTESFDFTITDSSWCRLYGQKVMQGTGDAFVLKFSPSSNSITAATFLGGIGVERAFGLYFNRNYKEVILSGMTSSRDFPTTKGAIFPKQLDTISSSDAFLTIFDNDLRKMKYSTYIGGSKSDVGKNCWFTDNGFVIITGNTLSTDFPISKNAFDSICYDTCRSKPFVIKFLPKYLAAFAGDDRQVCLGDTVRFGSVPDFINGKLSCTWTPKNGILNDSVPNPLLVPDSTRSYYLTIQDASGDIDKDSVFISVLDLPSATISGDTLTKQLSISDYYGISDDSLSYKWSVKGGYFYGDSNLAHVRVVWTDTLNCAIGLTVTNSNGCKTKLKGFAVTVMKAQKISLSPNGENPLIICNGDTVILDAGPGFARYYWSDKITSRRDSVHLAGKYFVIGVDAAGYKWFSDTLTVILYPKPAKPKVLRSGTELYCSTVAKTYRWLLNGVIIKNSDMIKYSPLVDGKYQVQTTNMANSFACNAISDLYDFAFLGIKENKGAISVFPVPTDEIIYIHNGTREIFNYIGLYNLFGELVSNVNISLNDDNYSINMNKLANGVYYLRINIGIEIKSYKIILSK